MTCAFAGYDLAMEAYKKQLKTSIVSFSYGDAMLVI
jgi:S-adenosylmethionine:tRNA ribosyltransferase-isomerase